MSFTVFTRDCQTQAQDDVLVPLDALMDDLCVSSESVLVVGLVRAQLACHYWLVFLVYYLLLFLPLGLG